MICPRCREKNTEEEKFCKSCGLKLKTICPRCQEPNKIGQPKCTKCNLTLIKFCPQCKAPNFPHVKECRKCGTVIRKKAAGEKKQKTVKLEEAKSQEIKSKKVTAKTEIPAEKKPEPEKKQGTAEKEIPAPDIIEQEEEKLPEEKQIKEAASVEHEAAKTSSAEEIGQEGARTVQQDSLKKELSRNEAAILLQEMISRADKGYLVGLSSPDGIGKSTITSSLTRSVTDKEVIWLIGQCEPGKKHVPYAFFKDLICTLFGLPVYIINKEETKKSLKKTMEINLGINDETVFNVVDRIVLNDYKECRNDISENHKEILESIQKIITALEKKAPVVLIVEDFEYIDAASFECLKYLLKNGFLNNENKNFLLINHNNSINLAKLFPEEVSARKFVLIHIKYLNNEELNNIIVSMMNEQDILPETVKYRIFRQSKGLPVYVEQALWYLFQLGAIYSEETGLKFNNKYIEVDIIPGLSELFMHRLKMIEKDSPEAEKVMYTAAAFGFKFIPRLVQAVTEIEDQKMQEILQVLVNNGIFVMIDQQTLAFKHVQMWKIIFEEGINSGKIEQVSSRILSSPPSDLDMSSAHLASLAEQTGKSDNMIHYYNNAVQEAFYLGDSRSYTENQIKVYNLLASSDLSDEEKEAASLNISEQIGKVNYEANPQIAVKYLSETIEKYEKVEEDVKVIELTGYLSRSYELTGDFVGVLECAEKAVDLTQKGDTSLEVILLKFPKLDASFNLGRLEETIITAQDEILPYLSKAISKNETIPGLTVDELRAVEYEAELILAKALIYQGNSQAVDILNKVAARAEKESKQEYELKALLGQALFSIIRGKIRESENIFETINEKGLSVNRSNETRLQWLFISILSNMMTGNHEQARNICYSALSLAKENRDYNTFSLVKLLSGYFYQHFQYYKNATTIYEETANYCSETKMATGALYSWYLAAEAEVQTGNLEKGREIAEKALDVSQKPNINNYIVTILLSRLIAEIKIINNDLEGARINAESALGIAEENNLNYMLIELYITLGKIYQESASANEDKKDYACSCAYRTYLKAYNLAEKIENDYILRKVNKVLSNLSTFCKLSGITLEK